MDRIFLDNDFEPEYAITRKNATTGVSEAATGLTGITARIAATDGGAAIHANLSKTASERSNKAGTYYAVIEGDDLRTCLASYANKKVWVVFGDGTNVLVSDAYVVKERRRSTDS